MKKFIFVLILFGLSFGLNGIEIMKLSEIQTGMEGEGKTIFKGTQIETFKFKVLGIMENVFPNKSLIIVELKSPFLENSGVISGMSGSPLYIKGKIIGAIAYSLNRFSKKPIGGVTPIEDILGTSEYNNPTFTIDISDIKIEFDKKNLKNITKFIQKEMVKRTHFSPLKDITSIKLISTSKGINPSALSFLNPVFTQIQSGKIIKKIKDEDINKKLFKISPADAASIPLIRGDFEYAPSGTVTHIDGSKIYLFGHPFFNLGKVEFPLHRAEIISVIPSYETPVKLAATKNMIGTVVQDRSSAIMGYLDRTPYMIPLKVFLKNRNRKFGVEIVNHPLLTPVLSYISLSNIFISEYQEYGFNSIGIRGKIFIENEKNIILNDLYSGTDSFSEFSSLILAINFFLMNNKEKNIRIQKIDFEINGSETIRKSNIDNVIVDKNVFLPGETMTISIYLKNERGTSVSKTINIRAPHLKPGATFYLLVGDKNEMVRFDSKNIKSTYFPIKLSSLIRIINNLRKNNRIYFKLLTPTTGLFIRGYEYSNLPSSLRNIFIYNSSTNVQSEMKYSTINEYQLEVPVVIKGRKLFKLKIKER